MANSAFRILPSVNFEPEENSFHVPFWNKDNAAQIIFCGMIPGDIVPVFTPIWTPKQL
jgi:hypothetical protein